MNAADVMTKDVITVPPEMTVREAAEILLQHRISAVPVVDAAGKLVGILSEGDLVRRHEIGTERRRSWWLQVFSDTSASGQDYVKSHGLRVADIMTRDVVTADESTSLAEIANRLERYGVKRLPIVRDGRVVGIVSRSNLVRALASVPISVPAAAASDNEIRESVMAHIRAQPWGMPWLTNASVHDGVVEIWGMVNSDDERRAIRVAAESTPGVRAVNDHMMIRPYAAE
ncbi:CBS domain-containing protein [Propylenella binzhouense]|uniref:CBS domain-containing protein n=1 Tax=Propylenella binzhouense TaxID=2555902 RepID=A0A964T670_9HYPH|nr:CBS domain-containing protein [Propylenella binzhouense]MYZ49276.1 CBS domain-containing protein [Propylenella binzhouense]